MAQFSHVQPGDLITAELINDIIDALPKLETKVAECVEKLAKRRGPTVPLSIKNAEPPELKVGEVLTLNGQGFITSPERNRVVLGENDIKEFKELTENGISFVVPPAMRGVPGKFVAAVQNTNGEDLTPVIVRSLDDRARLPASANRVVVALLEVSRVQRVEPTAGLALTFGVAASKNAKLPVVVIVKEGAMDKGKQIPSGSPTIGVGPAQLARIEVKFKLPATQSPTVIVEARVLSADKQETLATGIALIRIGERPPTPDVEGDELKLGGYVLGPIR